MVDRTKILSPGQMHGLKPWRIQLKNCPSQIATVPCRFTVNTGHAPHPFKPTNTCNCLRP